MDYFVQTEEPDVNEVDGIPIISFEKMMNMECEKVIFVAIKNNKVCSEITNKILLLDPSAKVIRCGSFIYDNYRLFGGHYTEPVNDTLSSEKRHCIVCEEDFVFLPFGIKEEVFNQYHIIGGGYRENSVCPCCGANDRMRWSYYVLKNKTDITEISGRVLHFAPEKVIADLIKQNLNIDYYTCDVVSGRAMHITDITDIQYKDNTFDYVICNHVMEHIEDEEKAVHEVKRVLKPNGKWVFSFPICTDLKTYEDKTITSPEARLKAFGQEDHVRLYGYDYAERFEKYGLLLEIFSPEKEMDHEEIDRLGFIKDDVVMIATKR